MGHMMMERVKGEDVGADRLWLERRTPFPRRGMPKLRERPPDRLTDEEADRLRALPDPQRLRVPAGAGDRAALGRAVPGAGYGPGAGIPARASHEVGEGAVGAADGRAAEGGQDACGAGGAFREPLAGFVRGHAPIETTQ